MSKVRRAIGLMSGTSLDGIDAAMIETDGQGLVRPGAVCHLSYNSGFRAELHDALELAANHPRPAEIAADLGSVTRRLSVLHAELVEELLEASMQTAKNVDVIGFHGQTVLHKPQAGITIQIGDGEWLAEEVGIPVVDQFRVADVAAGGEGAPFAPAYHRALVSASADNFEGPVVVVNIGGVSNVTFLDGDEDPLAFDTGPGNALLDDWVQQKCGKPYDDEGALGHSGVLDQAALTTLMDNSFFAQKPPKSLDRNDFSPQAVAELAAADGAATLTAFTANVVAVARQHFPKPPGQWVICGGGRHNNAMMAALRHAIPEQVRTAEDVGWQGDDIEAQAFAYLAVRSLDDLPLSWPSTTGVPSPMAGGLHHITRGQHDED